MARVKTEVVQVPGLSDHVQIKVTKESDKPGFISINTGEVMIPKTKISTLIKQLKAWK